MASNRHAFHPSQRPLIETLQPGLFAFGAGDLGPVALDVSTTTCIAGVKHCILTVQGAIVLVELEWWKLS